MIFTNTTGIYEQLITQLFEQNLDRETLHLGERLLEAGEAATWLSRFLTRLIEMTMDSVPNEDTIIHAKISFVHTIVQKNLSDSPFYYIFYCKLLFF